MAIVVSFELTQPFLAAAHFPATILVGLGLAGRGEIDCLAAHADGGCHYANNSSGDAACKRSPQKGCQGKFGQNYRCRSRRCRLAHFQGLPLIGLQQYGVGITGA